MSAASTAAEPTPAERPLAIYVGLMGTFGAALGAVLLTAEARGRLPERIPAQDLLLAGVAGHKLARLIAKEEVTAPIRAPFVATRIEDGEPEEEPAGSGVRRALGELLTCPSCVGQWACAGFVGGMLVAPRPVRAVAAVFAADAISDFLHVAYRAAKTRA